MELAIFEVSNINSAISLIPLKPAETVDEIIFELTNQNTILEMQRTIPLFFAIEKLTSVSHLFVSTVIVSKTVHAAIVKLSSICFTSLWRLVCWFSVQFTMHLKFLLFLLNWPSLIIAMFNSILKESYILAAVTIVFNSISMGLTYLPTAFVRIWFFFADVLPNLSLSFNHRPSDLSSIRCTVRQHQIALNILCLSLTKITLIVWPIGKDAVSSSLRKTVFPSSTVISLSVHDLVNFLGVAIAWVIETGSMVCVDNKLQSLESVSSTYLLREGCFSTGRA